MFQLKKIDLHVDYYAQTSHILLPLKLTKASWDLMDILNNQVLSSYQTLGEMMDTTSSLVEI